MEEEVRWRLDEAYSWARKGDYEKAISICDNVISEHAFLLDGLRKRAAIYAHMEDFQRAISDITAVIEMEPRNPGNHFFRGWWHFDAGNDSEAVKDLTIALYGGDENNHYHDESAYFFRAMANLRLGRYKEAITDCENVRDDFKIYVKSMGKTGKVDIVREAIDKMKEG